MIKRLVVLLILAALKGTAGTITGAAVQPDGYSIWLYVSGLNTNGTHNTGWTSNNFLGSNRLELLMTSPSYEDDGTTSTELRAAYATKSLRAPGTPDEDEGTYSGGIILKYGLDDWVCSGDTNLLLTTLEGLYAQGGTNLSAVSAMAVTNLSTQPYPKVVANWSWPSFRYIDSTTVTQYVFGAQWSAQKGRPLRAVRGTASDGTNTAVVWSTRMTQSQFGGAIESPDFQLVHDLSSFPRPNYIRFDFAAFPWIGDTNAVLDTAKVSDVHPTPKPAPVTNLVDGLSTWPIIRAVVATNGNNSTAVAANRTYWATNSSPPAFASVGGALVAIAATNNAQNGFNHTSGGFIYMQAGTNHAYLGSTCTLANGPRIFVELEPYPGVAREDVVFTTALTDSRCTNDGDMLLMRNVSFDTSSGTMFIRHAHLWMDQCVILNATAAAFFQATGGQNNWYLTRSTVSNLTQGLRSFTTQRLAPAIVRGNRIVGNTASLQFYTALGNVKTVAGSTSFQTFAEVNGGLTQVGWGQILGYNEFYNLRLLGNLIEVGRHSNIHSGVLIVNNLFEQTTNNTASTAYYLGSGDWGNTNLMAWNNTFVGTKNFFGYNDAGTNAFPRWLWSRYNNIWDDFNSKGDNFSPTNANRVGNWPILFGTASFGEVMLETENVGAPRAFLPDFYGTASWAPVSTSSTNFPMFWNRQAHDGANTMPGGGDYRLHSRSPVLNLPYDYRNTRRRWVLPYDLRGQPRGSSDGPGAYIQGNPRRSIAPTP